MGREAASALRMRVEAPLCCSPDRKTCQRKWPLRLQTSAWPRWTRTRRSAPRLSFCWEVWDRKTGGRWIPRLNVLQSVQNKRGAAAPLPLSNWLNAGDGDLLFRLLLLQSPGGGEGGGPSLRVPPGPESISHRERVVLVSANSHVLIPTGPNGKRATTCLSCGRSRIHFGGPEVKPGSSNRSSLERAEDLAPAGVSCSITCISDMTEWDTALQQGAHVSARKRARADNADTHTRAEASPPVAEAHPQPLSLLPPAPLHALQLLLLHLSVNLQLFVCQTHRCHTGGVKKTKKQQP